MRVAIISDTHFGGKNDNISFAQFQAQFYEGIFFPTLKREKITTIIHLGDVFDRRKYSNFNSLKLAKEMFFEPARQYDVHMLVGNHDCYYKNNNEVNSVSLTCAEYDNIKIYPDIPEVISFDDLDILMIPWVASGHYAKAMHKIKTAKADIVMGHLEIQGSEMLPGFYCNHGFERSDFKRYERVFSGHFHQQQDDGHIRYLGAPYEMFWNDWNTKKGFHIFDTSTREIEFIENKHKLFKKIYYDDTKEDYSKLELSDYAESYVKIIVIHKTDFYTFDRFIDRCYDEGNFFELKIVEDFSDLDPNSIADSELEDIEDTMSLLEKYVDEIDSKSLNKKKLHRLLKSLYVEASEVE
jgi:DNA repair exonuclease SbcCD nuclease subunit|tara:strand:- start:453 stop:1511 length:1059 start_codon:yes stop_codon:yes gene_type:complete